MFPLIFPEKKLYGFKSNLLRGDQLQCFPSLRQQAIEIQSIRYTPR